MSSMRGRALATVAVAAALALVSATPAEARKGYRYHRGGGGGCCSSAEWAAIGLGVAALGGFAYLAATRSSAPAATYYAPPAYYPPYYGPTYYYGPAYYGPTYYAPSYYAPAYYAPAYYYAPAPLPPPAVVPAAAPAYPPRPAYTTVNYYYDPGVGNGSRAVAAPTPAPAAPYGSMPYARTTSGTVVNPPSPYPTSANYQTATMPNVTAVPSLPVTRAALTPVP